MEQIKTIDIIIRKLMNYYGLNQDELCTKYRLEPSQVSRWLNKKSKPKNIEVYLRLRMEYDKIEKEENPLFKMMA